MKGTPATHLRGIDGLRPTRGAGSAPLPQPAWIDRVDRTCSGPVCRLARARRASSTSPTTDTVVGQRPAPLPSTKMAHTLGIRDQHGVLFLPARSQGMIGGQGLQGHPTTHLPLALKGRGHQPQHLTPGPGRHARGPPLPRPLLPAEYCRAAPAGRRPGWPAGRACTRSPARSHPGTDRPRPCRPAGPRSGPPGNHPLRATDPG